MRKNSNKNIVTKKIKYYATKEEHNIIFKYQNNYNKILRFVFNRVKETENKESHKYYYDKVLDIMNNVIKDTYTITSAIYDAKAIYESQKILEANSIVFGGKKLFSKICKKEISNEEWKKQRLRPYTIIGQKDSNGNRKFKIKNNETILFQPDRNNHIELKLNNLTKMMKNEIKELKELSDKKEISLTYKLDEEYVYISYDLNEKPQKIIITKKKENRIFAIDQNPNYLGWSVVDWLGENKYKVIDKGVISLKPLNDKWFAIKRASNDKVKINNNNKRKYEINKIGYELVKKANHYQCEIYAVEKLKFTKEEKKKQTKKQKHFHALVNNLWCRERLTKQIEKYCKIYKIEYQEVVASYSSFVGNLVYRKLQLPDMIVASIEIGRRAYEFSNQYIKKVKSIKKNIVMPNLELIKGDVIKSLEEIGYCPQFGNLKELYLLMRKSKQRYRFSLDEIPHQRIFSKLNKQKQTILYRIA